MNKNGGNRVSINIIKNKNFEELKTLDKLEFLSRLWDHNENTALVACLCYPCHSDMKYSKVFYNVIDIKVFNY